MFDPHCQYLPHISALNPGKKIDFVASGLAAHHPDQCTPLQAFGCDMVREFQVRPYSDGLMGYQWLWACFGVAPIAWGVSEMHVIYR
jgi:hypothetical protein